MIWTKFSRCHTNDRFVPYVIMYCKVRSQTFWTNQITDYNVLSRTAASPKLLWNSTYYLYEIPDHKVGIYCNVIGPLAALRHCAFSCKKVLRYFGNFWHQSNVRIIKYNLLIVLYIFIPLVRIASFLIIKTVVSRKNSLMSTHLWFVRCRYGV